MFKRNLKQENFKNKKALAILLGWFLIHFVLLISTLGDESINSKRVFWPFDNDPTLATDYDFIEFFIYGLIPLITFFIYIFISKENNFAKKLKISSFSLKLTANIIIKIILSIIIFLIGFLCLGAFPFFVGRIWVRITLFSLAMTCIGLVWKKNKAIKPIFTNKIEDSQKDKNVLFKYQTDKGEILIERKESRYGIDIGNKAFVKNQPAPDGKYKLSCFNYIHLKDGIVVKL